MLLDILGIVLPVLATVIAAFIAKRQASRELELKFDHLQKQWEHERELAAESRFSEMASAVAKAANAVERHYRLDALSRVAAIRAEASGPLAEALDRLYELLHQNNREQIEAALASVIQLQRNDNHQESPE